MKLLEYQAKSLFDEADIMTPASWHVGTVAEAVQAAHGIGYPVHIKAQVRTSGRMKAGGIKTATSDAETRAVAAEMLDSTVRGLPVESILIEETINSSDELYLGITMDRSAGQPVLMLSASGGIDVETAATEGAMARISIDPVYGLYPYQVRQAVIEAGIDTIEARPLTRVAMRLYDLWAEYDGVEIEINPLVSTESGLVALDAVFNIDDDALFRQPHLDAEADVPADPLERKAVEYDLEYVRLDGSIGVIGNGAGLVMATLDLIDHVGGTPANFLDVGGGADADRIGNALSLVFEDPNVDVVLFTIFGGITRCDEVAMG
ncbi:MAG: succinate--CoA ligase subunit beta, partial [Salinarchaeum sp.]